MNLGGRVNPFSWRIPLHPFSETQADQQQAQEEDEITLMAFRGAPFIQGTIPPRALGRNRGTLGQNPVALKDITGVIAEAIGVTALAIAGAIIGAVTLFGRAIDIPIAAVGTFIRRSWVAALCLGHADTCTTRGWDGPIAGLGGLNDLVSTDLWRPTIRITGTGGNQWRSRGRHIFASLS